MPIEKEIVFLKYFDIRNDYNNIEKALGCIKLQWSRAPETNEAWYDIQDVATIRGSAHVVQGDYRLERVQPFTCAGETGWRQQWFYVNRFREHFAEKCCSTLDEAYYIF